jgi:hypothetical protein
VIGAKLADLIGLELIEVAEEKADDRDSPRAGEIHPLGISWETVYPGHIVVGQSVSHHHWLEDAKYI